MKKRLFTFGCSFTSYYWPTWADIMSWDLDIPFENWGLSGLGNVGIFYRLVECNLRNQFTQDDLIIVLWSHWNREDRYKDNFWQGVGNVFHDGIYGEKFVKKYWSLENDIIKNSTSIIAANEMFKINFQGHITHPRMDEHEQRIFSEYQNNMLDFYSSHLNLNNIFVYDTSKSFNNLIHDDNHPDILQHLQYLKENIYPTLGLTIKDSTKTLCKNMQDDIIEILLLKKKTDIVSRKILFQNIINKKYRMPFELPKAGPSLGTKHFGF